MPWSVWREAHKRLGCPQYALEIVNCFNLLTLSASDKKISEPAALRQTTQLLSASDDSRLRNKVKSDSTLYTHLITMAHVVSTTRSSGGWARRIDIAV
jgi:hypothetical protein